MQINEIPAYDVTDNETNCCPRFHPEPWDRQTLHFEDKPFVRAGTVSLFHMPLNMGSVFKRTFEAIEQAHATEGGFMVLSHDDSAWHAEHLFSVTRPVAGADMVFLSGDFLTKVFEGPYSQLATGVCKWPSTCSSRARDRHFVPLLHYLSAVCEALRQELRCRCGEGELTSTT